jgi:hypothetical protein
MSIKPSPIECDVCGIEKKSVNHWWWLRLEGKKFVSGSLASQKIAGKEDRHACGSDHAGVLYQRFLGTGKLDKEMHPEPASRPVGLTEAAALGKEPEIVPFVYEEATATESKISSESRGLDSLRGAGTVGE